MNRNESKCDLIHSKLMPLSPTEYKISFKPWILVLACY